MAIHCIKYVCSSARVSWNLYSIAVAHRLGTVPVRETNIFIAVSSVHRADALEARRFIIDEVKAPIPIWKKAVYSNEKFGKKTWSSWSGGVILVTKM
ncbi:hypothetical protein Ahy_B08g089681 [Arachis hypogaea]|uniref:Molybdopterin synthase catalytic subunit n=1 Tax=Arachis hypogaea TaxID=3818 RepID=A0A444XYM1_ARAHY|nr:hypothetical protein Ahy_B08g089681 [Arachis hypogaea]